MKTNLLKTLMLFACVATAGFVTACGGTSSGDTSDSVQTSIDGNKKQYVFETEYTNLDGLVGGGISGSAAGVNMAVEASSASNGWCVSFLHKTGITITFNINSDKATTATMDLSLGNELQVMELNKDTWQIKVNDEAVNYQAFNLKANSSQTGTDFRNYTINPNINLVEGDNVITFTVGANEYCNGSTGGPMFDCMKLTTDATLNWEPKTSNIE